MKKFLFQNVRKYYFNSIPFFFEATLNKFVKQVASSNSMKVDGKVLELMDKLTIKYINHISQISCDVCNESGKKTLNINHIISALRKSGFENHIKSLQVDLNIDAEAEEFNISNMEEMKEKLNQKKKKKKDKKKNDIEFDEELKREQMMLFEQSRLEAYKIMGQENNNSFECGNKTYQEDDFIGQPDIIEEENYDY